MKKYLALLALVALIVTAGCKEQGPLEKAGEKIDNGIDNLKHGDAPLKEKGAMEKMGESIDDSLKKDQKN